VVTPRVFTPEKDGIGARLPAINPIESRNFLGFVLPIHHNASLFPIFKAPACLTVADLTLDGRYRRIGPADIRTCKSVIISPEQFLDHELNTSLQGLEGTTVFVEMVNIGAFSQKKALLKSLTNHAGHYPKSARIIPVVGEPGILDELEKCGYTGFPIALKGYEASGLCGMETVSLLFDAAVDYHGWSPADIIIWGGIATAEGASAFFMLGVRGIVHESLHWLTSIADPSPELRHRISTLSPEHTTVVGESIGLPIRLYDKGNSGAVRNLQAREDGLLRHDLLEARRCFLAEVSSLWKHPLNAGSWQDEILPLGPETAFARHFAARYGDDFCEAAAKYAEEITRLCKNAPYAMENMKSGRAVNTLGTAYPILQGAMSWITDIPDLASIVADAGALPTLALGLKSRAELEREFSGLSKALGNRPYAVNIIALDENPHLEEQIAWIESLRPPFVVVAAGSPAFVRRFKAPGTKVIYIAHTKDLIRLAAKEGASFIVLEGCESGGHVGTLTTLTLAQVALTLRREEPDLLKETHIVLAGGIYNRFSALRAAVLGAEAVQMGTAYLACREIVETGKLSQTYQQAVLSARPGDTDMTGHRVGLRVRALKSPKQEAIQSLEREMVLCGLDEQETRRRMEDLCTGSLLIAVREVRFPGGGRLEKEVCLQEGQYMCGAAAGNIRHTYALSELHAELFSAVSPLYVPAFTDAINPVVGNSPKKSRERIAVTGMAINNALGSSVAQVWANTKSLKSGITDVPDSRWNHAAVFHPEPGKSLKTYCGVAAFQSLNVSRKDIGVPPQDFNSMCESTRMTLWLAKKALQDSGLLDSDTPRDRIGVIISQNAGEIGSTVPDLMVSTYADNIVETIRMTVPMSDSVASAAAAAVRKGRMMVNDSTLLGRINSAAGGFICNQYGFQGPSFSVGAACATGLVALWCAYGMLRAGILDAVVVGGSEELLLPATFLEFSALQALAGASGSNRSQASRPFDANRDGMVLGEGGAVLIIERESPAKRRGAKIHAYLEGMGASNNDRGMVESTAENQQIAIQKAFKDAGWQPDSVGLIECHATSTRQGDEQEVKALKSIMPQGSGIVLASYKSQIGHTLGASGLMSLIRGVCAMKDGVFPATLNYNTPDPAIGLEAWGFRLPQTVEKWPRPSNGKRRLEVNAFGFGGHNYAALLEEGDENGVEKGVEGESQKGNGVQFFSIQEAAGSRRVAITADSEDQALARLTALDFGGMADRSPARLRILKRQGIFVESPETKPGKLGMVFAGQGTIYPGMGASLYRNIPSFRRRMDRMASLLDGFPVLDLLFGGDAEKLKNTRLQQPALFIFEHALASELLELGIIPECLAGHSTGELAALCFSGVFSPEDGLRIVNKRAQCMANASSLMDDPGVMLAVDADAGTLEPLLRDYANILITNLNSPTQTVIGGSTREVLAMGETLRLMGHRTMQVRVSMVFHSPRMRVIREELKAFIKLIPFSSPNIPVVSNTTGSVFPNDPDAIKKIVLDHMELPVQWIENVQCMHGDFGIGTFLEIGPSDVLCSMIQAILPDALCIPSCLREDPMQALAAASGELFRLRFFDPPRVRGLRGTPPLSSFDRGAALALVQRETARFALESVDRYLKPAILEALRREISPDIGMDEAATLMHSLLDNRIRIPSIVSSPTFTAEIANAPAPPVTPAAAPEPRPADHMAGTVIDEDPVTESVIQIIMDVTGYERNEIEPDMDIRKDLTIRSSRLPVIMDTAEKRFGISIQIMDFMTVRTVRNMAEVIRELMRRQGSEADAVSPVSPRSRIAQEVSLPTPPRSEKAPILRHVFVEAALAEIGHEPLRLASGKTVVVCSASTTSAFVKSLERLLSRAGGKIRTVTEKTPEAVLSAMRSAKDDLAGLVILAECDEDDSSAAIERITCWFKAVQCFMAAPHGSFALFVQNDRGMLFEGMLGMFLTASLEKPGTRFRCMEIRPGANLDKSFSAALEGLSETVEMISMPNGLFTTTIQPACGQLEFNKRQLSSKGGAVVLSGGARGITARIARAIAARGYSLVLCGTSPMEQGVDYERIFRKSVSLDEALSLYLSAHDLTPDPETKKRLKAGMEIYSTLADIRKCGVDAIYRVCDVTDASQVLSLIDETVARFGSVEGVIHGAGVLRDAFITMALPEDFALVCQVKCDGASHLFEATCNRGLKFFATFSSLAAYQGNIGQANYCAANRILAARMRELSRQAPAVTFKSLWLPPIEGAGMADDPEIREILNMRSMGAAYIDTAELARFFEMEVFWNEAGDNWVMPARFIPSVPAVAHPQPRVDSETCEKMILGHGFKPGDFPLIDLLDSFDPQEGKITTLRRFSLNSDPWIMDHRPITFSDTPLVSAVMGMENMIEAAALLVPGLKPVRLSSVNFLTSIPVVPGSVIETRCMGEIQPGNALSPIVATTIEAREPDGGWSIRFSGRVHFAHSHPDIPAVPGFPVKRQEIDTRGRTESELIDHYEKHTRLMGRYRLLSSTDGTSPTAIRGAMRYRETEDFGFKGRSHYLYSAYILEALMHIAAFFPTLRDASVQRSFVPAHIEAVYLGRSARAGEEILLEGRLLSITELGHTFDCLATDDQGTPLILAKGINLIGIDE
jgi:acyl transferase domain-containing protein/NAD(P)H-dependent flavin oxidoreductase YrpB (nitropropane dioxygenase family)/NAD(P)-dependent dehydrogenase (short-subunit alcohol dehydrogenase family)/acyl carrier protein